MQLIIIEKIYHPESVFCLSINSIEGFQNRNKCVFRVYSFERNVFPDWLKRFEVRRIKCVFLQQWDQEVLSNSILFLSPWFFWGVEFAVHCHFFERLFPEFHVRCIAERMFKMKKKFWCLKVVYWNLCSVTAQAGLLKNSKFWKTEIVGCSEDEAYLS